MDNQALILVVSFVTMLLINTPVAVAIGLSTLLAMLSLGSTEVTATTMVANKIAGGINSFPLLAIPFFVLSGLLMGRGGMARRLIDFSDAMMGRMPGGLSYVNTLTCMLFGSISGSAGAAVSSIGGFMVPEMEKKGYPREFSVAVTATAATTGLLIPPSNVMIIYATVTGVSVGAMFMAGVLPGILTGLCIMVACAIVSIRNGYGRTESSAHRIPAVPRPPKDIAVSLAMILIGAAGIWFVWGRSPDPLTLSPTHEGQSVIRTVLGFAYTILTLRGSFRLWPIQTLTFLQAVPSLMLIVIVIGGILTGKFSATEASAVAVLYSFLLAVCFYREVKWKSIAKLLLDAGATTAIVMFLIGTSKAMGWILTRQNIPQEIAAALMQISENPIIILLIINAMLLLVGTFMDMTPAILIFTPIFLPVVKEFGMNEVHFGILLIANLCIGLCTPPVGTCLFIGCGVGKTTIAKTTRPMIPFFIAMVIALMAITFIPALSTWLPELTGQLKIAP
jgi:TRAP-type C4-dicarboxylate transport system permease large subunit